MPFQNEVRLCLHLLPFLAPLSGPRALAPPPSSRNSLNCSPFRTSSKGSQKKNLGFQREAATGIALEAETEIEIGIRGGEAKAGAEAERGGGGGAGVGHRVESEGQRGQEAGVGLHVESDGQRRGGAGAGVGRRESGGDQRGREKPRKRETAKLIIHG
ncbi:hypothetical protein SLEP1_g25125 [Rubroshorea leprosula]|uniref:Uncharacterized protein n=1 Tax=Rubroshorea leprosula TaxID=152421 RepID=A0AAV5JSD0_9ROSI|nr:hypothetical protein SLEP1_g25125 [Rubroshorea leprosula]